MLEAILLKLVVKQKQMLAMLVKRFLMEQNVQAIKLIVRTMM